MVESSGFNAKLWLDQAGNPATQSLHVTERFHRRDLGHMEVAATIDDLRGIHQAVELHSTGDVDGGHGIARICLRREQWRRSTLEGEIASAKKQYTLGS